MASIIFTFAIAIAVAEQSFWPRTLKTPPWILLTIYELSSFESTFGCNWFSGLGEWLQMDCGCSAVSLIFAIFVFMWMTVATDIICQLWEMFDSMKDCMIKYTRKGRKCQLHQCHFSRNDPCAVICNKSKCQERKNPYTTFWENESAFQEQHKEQIGGIDLCLIPTQDTTAQDNNNSSYQNPSCSTQGSMDES
ncbi:hypothetical protein C0J52_17272 [Blattella germanica]|nr:hypothetical protein C0J52_17272 [Blattella germanica]